MNTPIDPKEENSFLISFLNRILYSLENLPFVYRTSGSETDIDSNSMVSSGTLTVSGTPTRDILEMTNLDSYSQQQMAIQASILQWCNTVRKKVV